LQLRPGAWCHVNAPTASLQTSCLQAPRLSFPTLPYPLPLSLTTCGISSVVFSIDRSASSSHHHSCCCFSAQCPIPCSSNLRNTNLPHSSSHPAASTPLIPPKQNSPILHHIELSPRYQRLPTTLLPSITQWRQQEQNFLTSDTQTVREQSLKSMTTNKQDQNK
jgi:hypothetical protein